MMTGYKKRRPKIGDLITCTLDHISRQHKLFIWLGASEGLTYALHCTTPPKIMCMSYDTENGWMWVDMNIKLVSSFDV